jgi:ABC-2 type transport system permease protein
MHSIHLFFKIIKYQFLAEIEYPGAYLAGIVGQWVVYGVEMLMMFLMVWNFGTLAGWLPTEIIFIFAIWLLTFAMAATFVFNIVMNLDRMVINGTMDEAFIRPMPSFVYLLLTNINIGYISHITLTSLVLGLSIYQLGLAWSIWEWLWLLVMLIAGAVITGSLLLLLNFPALRTRSQSPFAPLFWESRVFTQYPLNIYPRALQFIFTAILPLGFVNYYPAQVLLGRYDGLGSPATMWLSPVVAALLAGATAFCWRRISKFYESAGT